MKIAVTGIGIVSAIGMNVEETLHSLASGKAGMGDITLFESIHCGKIPVAEVKAGNPELKDKLGILPSKACSRTALLGMEAARQAYFDAGLDKRKNDRIGLVSGTSVGGMDRSELFYAEYWQNPSHGRLRNIVTHDCADSTEQIARHLHIRDHISTISTACSSAANAIMLGARLIKHGIVDCVIAGGTDSLCKFTLNGFVSLKITDEDECRPWDASRTGLNLGEGAGYIVLERADEHSGKEYACLSGYANVCEAFHQTASSPEGEGAYESMRNALIKSKLSPIDIDYINLHGTGTPNNDLAEGNAIRRLFAGSIPRHSSTKAFTGHTLGASGGIEAVLSVLAINKGMVYPNLRFSTSIPEHGLIPVTEFRTGLDIRHVLSNSFGFGGNDSTLIFSKS